MTATDTTASTLLVSIDISQHRHEVLIGVPGKKRRRRLTIMTVNRPAKLTLLGGL